MIKVLAFLMIPIFLNLYTLKYLYDVKKKEQCAKLNSPYLRLFFDMYIFELLLFCFLILVIQYFLRNPKKINFKKLQTYTKFVTDNKKVLELFGLFVSGIMIKMLYDIEKEPECKDIDIFMRDSLYYGNMIGFAVNTISILRFN
jgi:hypothetical protein